MKWVAMRRHLAPIPPSSLIAAVDLSEESLRAARQAAALSRALGTRLEVVSVDEHPPSVTVGKERLTLSTSARRRVASELRRRLPEASAVHVVDGEVVDALLRFASRRRASWLVLGTHGRTGLKRLMIGSVAEAMVLGCPIPVLIARGAPRNVRRVLAPVSDDQPSLHALQYAAELSGRLQGRVTAIHVGPPAASPAAAAKFAAGLHAGLPPDRRNLELIWVSGEVSGEIARAAADYDLVVLRADRGLGLSEVLLGGTAARVLRASPSPVLVLPSGIASRARRWRGRAARRVSRRRQARSVRRAGRLERSRRAA